MQKNSSVSELRHYLLGLRTTKGYLFFQTNLLLLALVIVILALLSPTHFRTDSIIILEFILLLFMTVDL